MDGSGYKGCWARISRLTQSVQRGGSQAVQPARPQFENVCGLLHFIIPSDIALCASSWISLSPRKSLLQSPTSPSSLSSRHAKTDCALVQYIRLVWKPPPLGLQHSLSLAKEERVLGLSMPPRHPPPNPREKLCLVVLGLTCTVAMGKNNLSVHFSSSGITTL